MPSDKEYMDFMSDQLSALCGVSWRAMMGEYILYYQGRVVGGIYDNRFLVKPTQSAAAMMPGAPREIPYPGGREMLLVENVDDREFLERLLDAMVEECPVPKQKREI